VNHLLLALSLLVPLQDADEAPLTSGRPAPPEQLCYDVTRYGLRVRVLPEERAIEGHVDVTATMLTPSRSLVLDLDGRLAVSAVTLRRDGLLTELEFEHAGGELTVDLGEGGLPEGAAFTVGVDYAGTPRVAPRAPWDGGFQWERTPSGAHWIATSNQMQGADLWWPCKDQPDDEPDGMDIEVTVPADLKAIANGRLVGVEEEDGWATWRWEVTTPINIYGVALNIAPYELIEREVESVTGERFLAAYWMLPENKEKGAELFEDFVRQIRWFEETFGPYPFRGDKAGLVETPHLGMEHQSVTAYGNEYRGNPWGEDQGFDFLLHHEFAHEYWANLVTCRNWNDFWIHEGFGTYAQSLYCEALNGPEGYRKRMGEIRRGIRNRAPVAPREPMSTSDVYFGATGGDIYNKGAWILHTLRFLVGDERFFVALRRMAYPDPALEATRDGRACRFSDTEEIRSIAERHTGMDLQWFFEVYLRQPELPRLVDERDGETLTLRWELPEGLEFPMPVEIEVAGERRRVEMPGGTATLEVPADAEVTIDPDAWLLMNRPREARNDRPRRSR
jgi:aminopeptidase N